MLAMLAGLAASVPLSVDAAARKLRTPALGEASYSLAVGDAWGAVARGRGCDRDPQTLPWDAALGASAAGFPAVFATALNAWAADRPRALRRPWAS